MVIVLTARVVSYVGLPQAALTGLPALLTCVGVQGLEGSIVFNCGCVHRQGGVVGSTKFKLA